MSLTMSTREVVSRQVKKTESTLTQAVEKMAESLQQQQSSQITEALQAIAAQAKPVDITPALAALAEAIREMSRPKRFRCKILSRDASGRVDEFDLVQK
jgi:hypothetical protein